MTVAIADKIARSVMATINTCSNALCERLHQVWRENEARQLALLRGEVAERWVDQAINLARSLSRSGDREGKGELASATGERK